MDDLDLSIAPAGPFRNPLRERLREERALGDQELAILDDERHGRQRCLSNPGPEGLEPQRPAHPLDAVGDGELREPVPGPEVRPSARGSTVAAELATRTFIARSGPARGAP